MGRLLAHVELRLDLIVLVQVHQVLPEPPDEVAFKMRHLIRGALLICGERFLNKTEYGHKRREIVSRTQVKMEPRKTFRIESFKGLLCSDDGYGDALEHKRKQLGQ